MNRLTILWFRGAAASDLDRPLRLTSRATRMHRYRVDGGTDENLAWIEAGDRREMENALSELSLPTGELFTFDLVRDLGVSSASPGRWLYLVHTDIPADIVDDYNAWYDQEHLSFDHLGGADQEDLRDGEAEYFCGREVDREIKPGRLFDRNVGRLYVLQEAGNLRYWHSADIPTVRAVLSCSLPKQKCR